MWGLRSNDKKREKCFFTQSDRPLWERQKVEKAIGKFHLKSPDNNDKIKPDGAVTL
ncbi:MAG: hypothetical protein ACOCG5_08520 [Candidatus Alkaliphilus sp. MAG34]